MKPENLAELSPKREATHVWTMLWTMSAAIITIPPITRTVGLLR